nr:probable leucine-rich repeat receptor-like serine/threonine-protein kinase At3g14840 [Tanacetum cinerariifolium]
MLETLMIGGNDTLCPVQEAYAITLPLYNSTQPSPKPNASQYTMKYSGLSRSARTNALQNLSFKAGYMCWISSNSLFGKIPEFIRKWNNLDSLRIQASGLEGPIPSSITLLRTLTHFFTNRRSCSVKFCICTVS